VLKLLLAEEQKLSLQRRALAALDRHIAKNDEFIAKQRDLIVQVTR
jgi:hypothetical protein